MSEGAVAVRSKRYMDRLPFLRARPRARLWRGQGPPLRPPQPSIRSLNPVAGSGQPASLPTAMSASDRPLRSAHNAHPATSHSSRSGTRYPAIRSPGAATSETGVTSAEVPISDTRCNACYGPYWVIGADNIDRAERSWSLTQYASSAPEKGSSSEIVAHSTPRGSMSQCRSGTWIGGLDPPISAHMRYLGPVRRAAHIAGHALAISEISPRSNPVG